MKTKTIELYEFSELPEDVRTKVLEKNLYINVDDSWWSESVLDHWKEKLEAEGFREVKISFSGFYSQGDGASFTAKSLDLPVFLKANKIKAQFQAVLPLTETGDFCASVIRISRHYRHENTVRAETVMAWNKETDKITALRDELESIITQRVRALSKQIYRDLELEYEGLTSNEAVIDTIEANEYTFRINGEMENA